ncbi:MAG: DNA repair protein RadA [Rickettsiales bacterium]|nr:DNA repair protein RadA [Rickettsiales bacterium]
MAKSTSRFTCQSCGAIHPKWSGKCDDCGSWNCIVEEAMDATPKGLSSGKGKKIEWTALDNNEGEAPRRQTGISELDRVLGGGLVAGSAVLIGGDPGIGKSTILLQAVAAAAKLGITSAYISGEESVAQVSLRAKRLGLASKAVEIASATSVRDIIATLDTPNPPELVIIDSVQTMFLDNLDAAPGTVSQVRAASHELIKLAKKRGITLFLVGHVTKDGQIAGPRVLEHMVDTVLYFEGERGHQFRILRSVKNRFGSTDEIGVFEMTDSGLKEVANPSMLFLSNRDQPISGACVFAGMEGSRPLLVEIQALVSPSYMSSPRRAVVGWDSNRLAMILAVLETRCGIRFSDKEVYLSVAGGIRINEPAADLAVAGALLSALYDIALPSACVLFGEIGLSGEIRSVARAEMRLKESEKLGFTAAYIPKTSAFKGLTIAINHVETVASLARGLFGANARKKTDAA